MRNTVAGATSVLVAMAALAGCAGSTPRAVDAPSHATAHPTASLPPVDVETGVVHVHGLGVDPADGTLYAATHSGLFSIAANGAAARVANRAQDTMGFAVVGPGQFIGSGHPDFREDDVRPPLLGLIESDDAGLTWKRRSLHGQADFHALRAAHGAVYGFDSTSETFMVSRDKVRWEQRSTLPLRDFVVDPASPERIIATTSRGLVASGDGGRSWAPTSGAPAVVVLAWSPKSGLFGVAVDGTVHRSSDAGRSWVRAGVVGGDPEALAVDERDGVTSMFVAVAGKGILVSRDLGRTFSTRYAEKPQ